MSCSRQGSHIMHMAIPVIHMCQKNNSHTFINKAGQLLRVICIYQPVPQRFAAYDAFSNIIIGREIISFGHNP